MSGSEFIAGLILIAVFAYPYVLICKLIIALTKYFVQKTKNLVQGIDK